MPRSPWEGEAWVPRSPWEGEAWVPRSPWEGEAWVPRSPCLPVCRAQDLAIVNHLINIC